MASLQAARIAVVGATTRLLAETVGAEQQSARQVQTCVPDGSGSAGISDAVAP